MVQRMNELAVQSANGTNTSTDRAYLDSEVQALMSEINRISSSVTFNEQNLLDGSFSAGKNLQVGSESGNVITLKISAMNCTSIGLSGSISTQSGAEAFIASAKDALKNVSQQRSDLGAIQNRLEHTINNLNNVVENTTSAESSIRDTDMATEMVKFSNNNILAQAGTSMLAQANQSNQNVLSLLS